MYFVNFIFFHVFREFYKISSALVSNRYPEHALLYDLHGTDQNGSAFGAAAIAVQRVGGQIESVSWNTADGFASALNAFTAQNFGAKKYDRIRPGLPYFLWYPDNLGPYHNCSLCAAPTPDLRTVFP